jgi:hypothetical protein
MMFYTYSHHEPDGTPFYIGKGCRKRSFVYHKRNTRYNRTVEKYGKENIVVRIYECATEAEAFALEKLQIMQCKVDGIDLANYAEGGVGGTTGHKPGPETRAKLSAAQLKIKRVRITPQCQAAGLQALRKRKGIPKSAEHRARIAAAHVGVVTYVASEETRKKMSDTHKRRYQDPAVRAKQSALLKEIWKKRKFAHEG